LYGSALSGWHAGHVVARTRPGCRRTGGATHWDARDFVAWTRHGCRSIGDAPHRKVYSPPFGAMPFKYHAEQRHHIPKPRYWVTNWAEYDASVKRRGSLTVWFTDEAIQAWGVSRPAGHGKMAVENEGSHEGTGSNSRRGSYEPRRWWSLGDARSCQIARLSQP